MVGRILRTLSKICLRMFAENTRESNAKFEEMITVLSEIEADLNLRPLSTRDLLSMEKVMSQHLSYLRIFLNYGQNQQTFPGTFTEIIEGGPRR